MNCLLITLAQRLIPIALLTTSTFCLTSSPTQARSLTFIKPNELSLCTNLAALNRPVTRADIAQVIAPSVSWKSSRRYSLEDVSATHPAYLQIQQAIALGWMNVDKNGRFRWDEKLTRDAGFAILSQAQGVAKLSQTEQAKVFAAYADASQAAHWTKNNLAIALNQGIVNTEEGLRPRYLMRRRDLCYGLAQIAAPSSVKRSQTQAPVNIRWEIVGAIALGTIGLILTRRKPEKPTKTVLLPRLLPMRPEQVKCLQVTEQQVSASGQLTILAQNAKVFLFPASFGDRHCTYVVKSLPTLEGQLFTIAISPDGQLSLTPAYQKFLVCNGLTVPPQGMTLEKHLPFKIEYQRIRWIIQPACEVPQRKTSAAYFAQLDAP